MDAILFLAILSLGMFLMAVCTSLFYIWIVRPTLLLSGETNGRAATARRNTPNARTDFADDLDRLFEAAHNANRVDADIQRMVRELTEKLEANSTQLESIEQKLTHGFRDVSQSLASQYTLNANSNQILQRLQDSSDGDTLKTMARRISDFSEEIDTMAEQVMGQEALVREMHAQLAPAFAAETIYGMLTKQAVKLNDLAGQLKAYDDSMASPESAATVADIDLERYQTSADALKDELQAQQATLRDMVEQLASPGPTQQGESNFEQAQQIGKLDARIDEQTDILTQQTQQLGEQRGLLEAISQQVNNLVPSVAEIKAQKPKHKPVRLTDIDGVGPVYAGLLYEAGVENFQQLAAFTPDELRNLVDVPSWRRIDAEGWIEQAQQKVAQAEKLEENR